MKLKDFEGHSIGNQSSLDDIPFILVNIPSPDALKTMGMLINGGYAEDEWEVVGAVEDPDDTAEIERMIRGFLNNQDVQITKSKYNTFCAEGEDKLSYYKVFPNTSYYL